MQTVQAKVFYRIPLVGGTTDYPEFYHEYGAQSICCAIDKYLTVSIAKNAHGGLKIESKADLSWGMGLGSSGAFNSALILALAKSKKQKLSKFAVAKIAYDLETGIDKHGTGGQDPIACLFTGVSRITYYRDDSVNVEQIPLSRECRKKLSNRLLLFDTGGRRKAGDSIKDFLSKENWPLLHEIAKLPNRLLRAWKSGDLDFLGEALNLQEHYRDAWSLNKRYTACIYLYEIPTASTAWDICDMQGYAPSWKDRCQATNMFQGGCFWDGALNYALWGKANALCYGDFSSIYVLAIPPFPIPLPLPWSLGTATDIAWLRKLGIASIHLHPRSKLNIAIRDQTLDLITYGYNGGSVSLSSALDCTAPKGKYNHPTEWVWNPYHKGCQ